MTTKLCMLLLVTLSDSDGSKLGWCLEVGCMMPTPVTAVICKSTCSTVVRLGMQFHLSCSQKPCGPLLGQKRGLQRVDQQLQQLPSPVGIWLRQRCRAYQHQEAGHAAVLLPVSVQAPPSERCPRPHPAETEPGCEASNLGVLRSVQVLNACTGCIKHREETDLVRQELGKKDVHSSLPADTAAASQCWDEQANNVVISQKSVLMFLRHSFLRRQGLGSKRDSGSGC